jgi:hypothetical protein
MALTTMFGLGLPLLAPASSELEEQVLTLFDDECAYCHPPDDAFPMEGVPLQDYAGRTSLVNQRPMIVPGKPEESYLYLKMATTAGIDGDIMPPGAPVSDQQLKLVRGWIDSLLDTTLDPPKDEPEASPAEGDPKPAEATDPVTPQPKAAAVERSIPGRAPFHGTHQSVLPTTTTLGRNVLQYRIDHRFGQIGAERGAFGLDAGAIISFGLAFGILDGWDATLRRSSSLKGYELGTKYVPVRQEAGSPVSFGAYASIEYFRDFAANLANPWSGNFVGALSRLWFDRWSTMLSVGYHLRTNHAPRVVVDLGNGPRLIHDRRDTLTVGVASTVWVDRRRRWGIDLEYFLPIPDGGSPRNAFYYRGGDADPDGTKIGAWTIGGSYRIGRHFFQLFLTNNREIHTNLAAPGGQTANPFPKGGRPNFFLGFNLARTFQLGKKRSNR